MVPIQTYKQFLTELIRKHMIIFGPNIACGTANAIPGLRLNSSGEVIEITGEPVLILENLSREYQKLSVPITVLNLSLLFDKFPDIKAEYNQPLPRVRMVCNLNDNRS